MKQKKYYNYCVDILQPNGKLWFSATFGSKAKALLWLDGFRHAVMIQKGCEYPKIGREYVCYLPFKPRNG